MALYEFYCDHCNKKFEQITRAGAEDMGECPTCRSRETRRLISKFAVGGQGDLRESTLHGCHDNDDGTPHDHGSDGDSD